MGTGASHIAKDFTGSYTIDTCHQLCQEDQRCQSFTVSTGGACNLFNDGVCTKVVLSGTTSYVKSDYYEDPFYTIAGGICTHKIPYNEDGVKTVICKEQTT
jgi:hypothetical protein